ncbi:ATP-dependent helicase [Candidatus Saccharibacteria bacterium]|nr:ATP-dependent helicase [Candidatus Saccharibacteria bacterium]
MEFDKAYNHLNENQRAAVDHIDGPLLVIAGPGTGKTQLLSVRVANILKQTDANPENILCLTFTETGASNMRHRLADFIGPEAYKVQIQTYHAFGSYILQEHRPDLNAAIDDLERFTLIRKIQANLPAMDILRPDYFTPHIISAISELKAAALTPNDLRKIVQRNEVDNGLIYSAISEKLQETKGLRYPKSTAKYTEILEALQSFINRPDNQKPILGKVEPVANIYYRELAEALLAEENSEKPSSKLPGKWREKFFKKNKQGEFVFGDDIANKKLLSLAGIMEQYQAHLDAEGLFDYDDMILNAINLLETDDEIRYNAQERFQYILLDEFQDTNDAQAKLVSLLTDNPSNEGRPNIMAVGDDDQAIYGFQGANTSNFFDFDAKYHPKQIFLTKNYRSSEPILEFAHNVIEQGADRFCKSPSVNIDKHITAENPPEKTSIELRSFKSYQSEYSYIAAEIHRLMSEGVPGSKISIIAPKHKYLVSILPYLHAMNIPISYTRRDNILEDAEVSETINCAKLVNTLATGDMRKADPYCFRAISLPYWNLKNATIVNLLHDAREKRQSIFDTIYSNKDDADAENLKLHEFADFFMELAKKATDYSAESIIAKICNIIINEKDDLALFSKLNTLREIIGKKASRGNHKFSVEDFCNYIDAYNSAELQIVDSSPYSESDEAVVLQTVHSSKGLEYEAVFLIAADNKNWSDAGGNRDLIKLPRNLAFVRHTGDTADEKIRVFFVAITRAKAKLYLTYSLSDFAGHEADRLKFLDIREDTNPNTGEKGYFSKIIPEPFNFELQGESEDLNPEDFAPNRWFDDYIPSDETKKNLLKPYVEHFRLTPTGLNTFVDLRYNGPEAFLRRFIIGEPSEANFSADYGTLIHDVMDQLNRQKLSNEDALNLFKSKVADADATDKEKDDLLQRGEQELSRFLEERGDYLRSVKAESERSFSSEGIVLGEVPLTGKIDRIEINEEEKTITVADYKTGTPKSKWGTADSTFTYKIQLYFYKFLIENCRAYQNYKVTKGRIDYIPADSDGDIVPLELNFKDTEAEQIKKLIQVVYKHIKSLDFPDTSEANKNSNPTKAFFDQLLSEE